MDAYLETLGISTGLLSVSVALGGLIPLFVSWSRRHLPVFLSCSAGVMLGATLLHLLPEAFELVGKKASLWALVGFLFLYIFERFVTVHICEALDCEVHTLGVAAVVGISAHGLTDGIALGSGLLVSGLGFVILLTIFFHKLPEAFALTSILLHESQSRGRILLYNVILIVMIPLGGLMLYILAGVGSGEVTGIALAFSAGTFLHIAISDLLPEVHKFSGRRYSLLLSFLLGLLAMYLIGEIDLPGGIGV